MSWLLVIVLAIVQGLTEFLPVSSSGHLAFISYLWNTEPSLFFTVILHVGTLAAVIWVYRNEIAALLKGLFLKDRDSLVYTGYIFVTSFVTVLIALLGKRFFEDSYSNIPLIVVCWFVTAVLLFFTDRIRRSDASVSLKTAIVVGFFQGIAILPGISRSGLTIIAALFMGVERKKAAQYAFLVSIPVILGSAVFELKDVLESGSLQMPVIQIIVGVILAALTGYAAIQLFIKTVLKGRLVWFSVYLFLLATVAVLHYIH